jgi:SAM-dependent methyltransferase
VSDAGTFAGTCLACGAPGCREIYRSRGGFVVTSLGEVRRGELRTALCHACGHLRSSPIGDLAAYYDEQYRISLDSDDDDQLYAVVDGKRIFRVEHQVATLLALAPPAHGARVLDYGCAKGASARKLLSARPDLSVHLFDVSTMYTPFWAKFVTPDRWATHRTPDAWKGSFDVVMSLFVLEHVEDPVAMLAAIRSLLRPGGRVVLIVPNVWANSADFIVADHINHFGRSSLGALFARAGFVIDVLDDRSFAGAWTLSATATAVDSPAKPPQPAPALAPDIDGATNIARVWSELGDRVRAFESANPGTAAVYGSGVYGAFIATCLSDPDRLRCFLDQSPFRRGKRLMDRPIVAPDELPNDTKALYVGLNPAIARRVIDGVESVRRVAPACFFVEA